MVLPPASRIGPLTERNAAPPSPTRRLRTLREAARRESPMKSCKAAAQKDAAHCCIRSRAAVRDCAAEPAGEASSVVWATRWAACSRWRPYRHARQADSGRSGGVQHRGAIGSSLGREIVRGCSARSWRPSPVTLAPVRLPRTRRSCTGRCRGVRLLLQGDPGQAGYPTCRCDHAAGAAHGLRAAGVSVVGFSASRNAPALVGATGSRSPRWGRSATMAPAFWIFSAQVHFCRLERLVLFTYRR